MKTKFNDFLNESKLQDDYRGFFQHLLKLYGVKSPAEFKSDKERSKKFYTDIKKAWIKGQGLSKYGQNLLGKDELVDELDD